jgi:hypothetical protein
MGAPKTILISPGDRYGKLTIVREVAPMGKFRKVLCVCECSNEKEILLQNLRSGITISCGCYHKQRIKDPKPQTRKENFEYKETRLFKIWEGIKKRCYNKRCHAYKYYGAKGIELFTDWHRFLDFRKWALNNGYSDKLTIERMNVEKNYEPGNCTWIPLSDQNNNKSNSRKVRHGNDEMTVAEWSKKLGIKLMTLTRRLNAGWSVQDALFKPIDKRFSK